jgi:chemotaxis response regulator CheB
MIRLAVVDDHPAIAVAIADAARGHREIEFVGRATDVSAAVALIEGADPMSSCAMYGWAANRAAWRSSGGTVRVAGRRS